uniref:Uncharacterized protein n=1 Tax=Arundo donax TaxID=35708 RepID=A0A0A8YNH1_ARUDO
MWFEIKSILLLLFC